MINIDPVAISTLEILISMAVGLTVYLARLGQRVSRLESDVGELKQGQEEIKDMVRRTNEIVVALMNHRHGAEGEPTLALPAD